MCAGDQVFVQGSREFGLAHVYGREHVSFGGDGGASAEQDSPSRKAPANGPTHPSVSITLDGQPKYRTDWSGVSTCIQFHAW